MLAVEAVLRAIKGKLHCLMESFLTDHNNVPLALISKLSVTQESNPYWNTEGIGEGLRLFQPFIHSHLKTQNQSQSQREKEKEKAQFIALFICIY